jgi:hypothetical protein
MDRFIPKPQHRVIPAPPVPEGQTTDANGTYINENKRCFQVHIFDSGKDADLATAIGTLEIAKDIVKQKLSEWHIRDKQAKAIIVPKVVGPSNGN